MEEKLKRIRLEKVWRNFCGEDLWEIVLNEFEEPQLKQQGLDDNIFSKRLQ